MRLSTFMVTTLLMLGLSSPLQAGCPPVPKEFVLPSPNATPVNLIEALDQPWQADGQIALICGPEGQPRAGRIATAPKDRKEEMARRKSHFALAKRINMAQKGEVNARTLALNPKQLAFLERFALSDAGATWFLALADDTLRLFNAGHLEYDQALWKRALRQGRMPPLAELLTGRLSEAGQFKSDLQVFKFGAYTGPGALSQPSGIGLGDEGIRCQFPSSNELVDPMAILSHEFGHTRYGDPSSSADLIGEARTVELYENPVRERNGYPPRTIYFQRNDQGLLDARNRGLLEQLELIEKKQGIDVQSKGSLERYHCDCPGPLPIILDCEVRKTPTGETSDTSSCSLRWRNGDKTPAPR
jgi:hypothetical protein